MTGQEKREKVFSGLRRCSKEKGICQAGDCPYNGDCIMNDMNNEPLLLDALALLEAQESYIEDLEQGAPMAAVQTLSERVKELEALLKAYEPRLVTESDFENADANGFIPAWCEVKERDGSIVEFGYTAVSKAAFLRRPGINRFWTSRPTDAQREAEEWK